MKKLFRLFIISVSLLLYNPEFAVANLGVVYAKVILMVSKNVDWGKKDIDICTYGFNRVGHVLEKLAETFKGAGTINKFNILENVKLENLEKCNVVYIAKDQKSNLPAIMEMIATKPILTVSEMEGFRNNGGILEIKISRRGTLKLDFNKAAITKSGIKINPTFLIIHKVQ